MTGEAVTTNVSLFASLKIGHCKDVASMLDQLNLKLSASNVQARTIDAY